MPVAERGMRCSRWCARGGRPSSLASHRHRWRPLHPPSYPLCDPCTSPSCPSPSGRRSSCSGSLSFPTSGCCCLSGPATHFASITARALARCCLSVGCNVLQLLGSGSSGKGGRERRRGKGAAAHARLGPPLGVGPFFTATTAMACCAAACSRLPGLGRMCTLGHQLPAVTTTITTSITTSITTTTILDCATAGTTCSSTTMAVRGRHQGVSSQSLAARRHWSLRWALKASGGSACYSSFP